MDIINSSIPIGRFSILTRISQKNLRNFDSTGILIPSLKDPATGYRYYSLDQISTALKINTLKFIGFNNSEIKDLMILLINNESIDDQINFLVSNKVKDLQLRIKKLQIIKSVLLQSKSFEELIMNVSEPNIKETEEIRVISKREFGTYQEIIPKLITELFKQIHRRENNQSLVKITGPIMCQIHDKEYKDIGADIEILIPIVGKIYLDEGYEVKKIPKRNIVSVMHTGPYNQVGLAYDKAFQYLKSHNLEINGPYMEIYLNSPQEVPEEQLLTEIQVSFHD